MTRGRPTFIGALATPLAGRMLGYVVGLAVVTAWPVILVGGSVLVAAGLACGYLLIWLAMMVMLHRAGRSRDRPPVTAGPVDPVIVVGVDDGCADVFLRLADALSYMEARDVDDGGWRLFLPSGEECSLWISAGERVQATPTGRFDEDRVIAAMRRGALMADDDSDLIAAVWRAAR